jgi:DNA repair exonuclease SbcCD ATPase subunit
MNQNAYVSSNAPRQAEIEEQVAAINEQIKAAEQELKQHRSGTREARQLKKRIAELTEQRLALKNQLPAMLFSEAGALTDIEADIEAEIDAWERIKSRWLADAQTNPLYAIKNARNIVGAQAKYEQVLRLDERWQALAAEEGRTLATFRKAYDQVLRSRRRDMMSKLTQGSSTCEFHNAVERQQGRALAELDDYGDQILLRLTWYETDAARMAHID